jgi:hypothetical protein
MSTTGPVIWMTLPTAALVAGFAPGDVRLANLVVGKGQVLDQLVGVLGRVLHCHHPARLLGRLAFEDRLEDAGRHVARQESSEDRGGVRLEDELVAGDALRVLAGSDRQQGVDRRPLDERGLEVAVDDVDPAEGPGDEPVAHQPGQRQDVGEGRPVAEAGEMGFERDPSPAHRVAALAPDRDDGEVARIFGDLAGGKPDGVRVQRAREAPVGRDQHDQAPASLPLGEQGVLIAAENRGQVGQDLVELVAVGAGVEGRFLGALELGRGDELHRPGDLLDVLHRPDTAANVPLTSHYLATSIVYRLLALRGPSATSGSASARGFHPSEVSRWLATVRGLRLRLGGRGLWFGPGLGLRRGFRLGGGPGLRRLFRLDGGIARGLALRRRVARP